MSNYTVTTYPPLIQPRAIFDDPEGTARLVAEMAKIAPMPEDDVKVHSRSYRYRVHVGDSYYGRELDTAAHVASMKIFGITSPTMQQLRWCAAKEHHENPDLLRLEHIADTAPKPVEIQEPWSAPLDAEGVFDRDIDDQPFEPGSTGMPTGRMPGKGYRSR